MDKMRFMDPLDCVELGLVLSFYFGHFFGRSFQSGSSMKILRSDEGCGGRPTVTKKKEKNGTLVCTNNRTKRWVILFGDNIMAGKVDFIVHLP
ncbi:hypothetical protein SDJN02_14132 [Cucurbita argyrosperma subsp. argyrosperma]|nr:hypothetical protein SDJN02_14132 [Cucurbita argyrosperma subsp. argyrosperma]